jgi:aminoglycoside/choline kinase family phosphotransferase
VPSPTFSLQQVYDTGRIPIAHFDFYRLGSGADLAELGFDEALARHLVVVEWPQRAPGLSPPDRLEVQLVEASRPDRRAISVSAHGSWSARLARLDDLDGFLTVSTGAASRVPEARLIRFLQGDASTRAYARLLHDDGTSTVLMDCPRMADGPPVRDGRSYSRIAHLAEDVRPFVAIAAFLQGAGVTVPGVLAHDLARGFLLLEDLGDRTFGRAIAEDLDCQRGVWGAAVDLLVHLRSVPVPDSLPLPDGTSFTLPRFDRAALEIEVELLLDWYWPYANGTPADDAIRAEFRTLWSPLIDRLLRLPPSLFLRDFHSPNLFWLPEREGLRRVGVIDFQDALVGHCAFDAAALLQDARVDVPAALERDLLARYADRASAADAAFDEAAFRSAYALFGAQRNTRLIGLWVRLWRRDGKPGYMAHMPRTLDYLRRNLAHPDLHALKGWYERYLHLGG